MIFINIKRTTMKPSALRRKEAVQAAKDVVYGNVAAMPSHFDERQERIFNKYLSHTEASKRHWDEVDNDMWIAYTGMTREEYCKL